MDGRWARDLAGIMMLGQTQSKRSRKILSLSFWALLRREGDQCREEGQESRMKQIIPSLNWEIELLILIMGITRTEDEYQETDKECFKITLN